MTAQEDVSLSLATERHDAEITRRQAELDAEETDLVEDLWAAEWSADDAADVAYKNHMEER